MDREDAPYPTNPGDLSPAPSHEDLARGNDRDLCLGREGAAASLLQPKLQEFSLRDDGGEEGRKANPRLRRHGGVEHELSGGAFGVDPRGTTHTFMTRRRQRRRRPWRSASTPSGPSMWAYKGSGNPGGGRSHQGLDTT